MKLPLRSHNAVLFLVVILAFVLLGSTCAVAIAQTSDAAGDADFYRPDVVQSVFLNIEKQDLDRMLTSLPERIYVRASFKWRNIVLKNVAVRFKGNSSSQPSQQHKRSFLVKFDEYEADQHFLGLARVSFDNGVQFGSVFSEPIITEILRDLGVKTQRSNYAKLYVNDEYRGVYVNVERIDQIFIEHHLPDPKGLLFKVNEGGPGGNLQFIGDEPALYKKAFSPETKSAKNGQQKLVEFIKLIQQSPDAEFSRNLESKIDVEILLRQIAVLLFSGAFDQLTGWNPHNYYLYHDSGNDRWNFFPWDLDVGFCEKAFGRINVLSDWNAAWPTAGQIPNPLLDRIVADPNLLERYRATAREVLEKQFEPDRLCAVIDAKYALIRDDLKSDPFPHRRITNPEDKSYDDIVASMKTFVRKRYTSATQQLDNPGNRPAMSHRPDGMPPQLVEKIQRIQKVAEKMQRNGQDIQPIRKLMDQVGPLLHTGRVDEAEKVLLEVLKLIGET